MCPLTPAAVLMWLHRGPHSQLLRTCVNFVGRCRPPAGTPCSTGAEAPSVGGPEAPAEALVPGGDRVHAVSHPRTRLTGGSDCTGPDRFPGQTGSREPVPWKQPRWRRRDRVGKESWAARPLDQDSSGARSPQHGPRRTWQDWAELPTVGTLHGVPLSPLLTSHPYRAAGAAPK